MSDIKVASRYAVSFLQQARQMGLLEQVYKDVILFKEIGRSNKDLLKILRSPIVRNEKKWTLLKAIFTSHVSPLTLDFFAMVSHHKREGMLYAIMDVYLEQYYASQGIQVARVTTPFKLSADLVGCFKNLVKTLISCKEVILLEYVNPAIQGGFILRIADKQLDNSLSNKLYEMKKQFSVADY